MAATLKVSEKGGVSVYGRFPVTLYQEQWIKLLDMADSLHQRPLQGHSRGFRTAVARCC